MRSSFSSTAVLAAASGMLLFVGTAGAAVEFQTGNIQYTNVNIVADQDAFTITAHIDALPVHVYFDGYGAGPAYPATMLHGQHGVAFVEAFNPLDDLFRLTLTASLSVLPGSLLTDSENTRRMMADARNPPARQFLMPNLLMLIRDGKVPL